MELHFTAIFTSMFSILLLELKWQSRFSWHNHVYL